MDPLADPTPLRVAAWRLAQLPIPCGGGVAGSTPDVLPALVRRARESLPGIRLAGGESARRRAGALPIEALRDLSIGQCCFRLRNCADALEQVEALEPALGRALMLQAIEAANGAGLCRAELLAAALSLAEAQGRPRD